MQTGEVCAIRDAAERDTVSHSVSHSQWARQKWAGRQPVGGREKCRHIHTGKDRQGGEHTCELNASNSAASTVPAPGAPPASAPATHTDMNENKHTGLAKRVSQ